MPLSVCEVIRDLPANGGKDLAVIGRYSYRDGRSLSLMEQACQPTVPVTPQLRLLQDANGGPKPPEAYQLSASAVYQKLADIRKRTQLGKFRFGTPDYDRWAVVYGRVEPHATTGADAPAADLVFRGNGVVLFLNSEN